METETPSHVTRMFHSFLSDPYFAFNYNNVNNTMSDGTPFKIMDAQHDYLMGLLLSDEIVIASGRSVGKTSSLELLLFMFAMCNPYKDTGYIVRNERHTRGLAKNLEAYFNRTAFTRQFYIGYDRKEKQFRFKNGHTIEIRIVGHDKTGATTLVAGHYNLLVIDEAQILSKQILKELLPTMQEGAKLVVAGVPNNIRDSVLFNYCTDKDAMYYRYSSTESADWDEKKHARAVKNYGKVGSPDWENLVEGKWGDAAANVWKPSMLVENIKRIECFKFFEYDGNEFSDLQQKITLPMIVQKYKFFVMGGDMGYTDRSPLHIVIMGAYDQKSKDEAGNDITVEHYDIVFRLEIANMAALNVSKTINFLMNYFDCKHAAIDAQSVGYQMYDCLISKELFPETYLRNKQFIIPLIFGDPLVYGVIKTIDQETGLEIEEERRYSTKVVSTMKLQELVESKRLHTSSRDQGDEDFIDIIEIMQSEAQTRTTNRLHPWTYSNVVNDHCTDALRCCGLVILQVIERGLFLNRKKVLRPVRPKRLEGTRFNKTPGRKIRRLGR